MPRLDPQGDQGAQRRPDPDAGQQDAQHLGAPALLVCLQRDSDVEHRNDEEIQSDHRIDQCPRRVVGAKEFHDTAQRRQHRFSLDFLASEPDPDQGEQDRGQQEDRQQAGDGPRQCDGGEHGAGQRRPAEQCHPVDQLPQARRPDHMIDPDDLSGHGEDGRFVQCVRGAEEHRDTDDDEDAVLGQCDQGEQSGGQRQHPGTGNTDHQRPGGQAVGDRPADQFQDRAWHRARRDGQGCRHRGTRLGRRVGQDDDPGLIADIRGSRAAEEGEEPPIPAGSGHPGRRLITARHRSHGLTLEEWRNCARAVP